MKAALKSMEGKLLVRHVLSPYPVDHKAVVNALGGPWRLRKDVVSLRITSNDGHFVITFTEEGDRQRLLNAGPWHFWNDVVLFADLDGKENPPDVCLDSFNIWAQIQGLLIFLKTEEMGWILCKKLGTVLAVSHRNKKITDDHLRVHVEHKVDKPLRKYVDTTPTGSKKEIHYYVMYEKLPNLCFCYGFVGHATEKLCSIPNELRKASFLTDIRAQPYWRSVRRHIDFWGAVGAL